MLRQSIKPFVKKDIPVPPLCESDVKEVEVEVKDPLTGDVIGSRKEHTSIVRELSEESAVSNEPADLYSIENMQRVGISPVVCPRCGYVNNDLDSVSSVENVSEDLLFKSESPEPAPEPTPEPTKTE